MTYINTQGQTTTVPSDLMNPTCRFCESLSSVSKLSVLWRTLKILGLIIALNRMRILYKFHSALHIVNCSFSSSSMNLLQCILFYHWVWLCKHECMNLCTYVCMYIYRQTCIYVCMCVHTYACIHTYVCCIHVCEQTCMCICVYVLM